MSVQINFLKEVFAYGSYARAEYHTLRSHSKQYSEQAGEELTHFLAPLLEQLDALIDKRLVHTFFATLVAIVQLCNRGCVLLLSELGGYILSPHQAPAGTKRLSNLLRSTKWHYSLIERFTQQQADRRVEHLFEQGEDLLVVWDESELEKSESIELEGLCLVRSLRAARLDHFVWRNTTANARVCYNIQKYLATQLSKSQCSLLWAESDQPMRPSKFLLPNEGSTESGRAAPHNLPVQATPLVGRAHEIATVLQLLGNPDVRLLSLLGPPGIGKTRLSLQVASLALSDFPDGVFFVPLAPVTDPDLVASAIAQALGARQAGGQSIADALHAYLRDKQMLLLLDNFEQVAQAASLLTDLLDSAPGLKVLITSRILLQLYGEHSFHVPPLTLPTRDEEFSPSTLPKYEAVALFLQRARAAKPDFAITEQNAADIVAICRRLDGVALAIELAAARLTVLSPQALLARLDNRLKVLKGGSRNLPPRQQTLRGAIEWSYDLLDETEKVLFRSLSVFNGGCTLEAAELVCGAASEGEVDVLDGIHSLVNSSLLRAEFGEARQAEGVATETRFRMLETILEYAREKLEKSDEEQALKRGHAGYYLALAEEAEKELKGLQQALWLARLEAEHDNLRAALRWAEENGETEIGLRLSGALGRFWEVHGYYSEGRERLARFLQRAEEEKVTGCDPARAKALHASGNLALRQGNYEVARSFLEQSLEVWRDIGNKPGAAYSLSTLGSIAYVLGDYAAAQMMMDESLALLRESGDRRGIANLLANMGTFASRRGDYEAARELINESVKIQKELGDKRGIANCLHALGLVLHRQGDHTSARAIMEEALEIRRELGDRWGLSTSLLSLGEIARSQGDYAAARALSEESLSISRELGDKLAMCNTLYNLGFVAHNEGNQSQAIKYFSESMDLAKEQGYKRGMIECIGGLALVAAALGLLRRATFLFGATESLREAIGAVLEPVDRDQYERNVAAAQAQLDEAEWRAEWDRGKLLAQGEPGLDRTIAYALEVAREARQTDRRKIQQIGAGTVPTLLPNAIVAHQAAGLTRRETDVLRLVASGLSNAEIAEKLHLSYRTVEAHLYSIYNKIGVTSRSAATRYAVDHGIV